MKKEALAVLCVSAVFMYDAAAAAAASTNTPPRGLVLANGWRITQDVRYLGEKIGWYEPGYVVPELRPRASVFLEMLA